MSAGRLIASLRTLHDRLEAVVAGAGEPELSRPSGASDWSVAQVLSHLGSGAEIFRGPLAAAISGEPNSTDNQAVWDRWNAWAPQAQAAGFLEHDERLLALLEGLTAAQRETLQVDLGFLPEPVALSTALALRLNEVAAHAWDVAAADDPAAELDAEAGALLAEAYAGELGFMLGSIAKADQAPEPAVVAASAYTIEIGDGVRLVPGSTNGSTAVFSGTLSALVRLLTGRLGPAHTPGDVQVEGNLGLDDLRRVFPGF